MPPVNDRQVPSPAGSTFARKVRKALGFVGTRPESLAALAGLGVAFYFLIEAHAHFMLPTFRSVSMEQGSIAVISLRMLRGHMLPYVDGVSQRGPLLYWMAAGAQSLGGRNSFASIRILALLDVLVACTFTFAAAARAGRPLAGAIAALGFPLVTVVSMGPHAGLAYNGELTSLPFTAAALYSSVVALDARNTRPKLVATGLAGACVSLGLLCKQLAGVFLVPIGLWFLCAALTRSAWSARQRRWMLVAFVVGTLAPLLAVVVRYAAVGHFHDLVYWGLVYNATVYMAPASWAFEKHFLLDWATKNIILLAAAAPLVAWGVVDGLTAPPWRLLQRWDERGLTATVALGALTSLAAALAESHDWSNYFLYCVPWFGLLLGLAVERLAIPGGALSPWPRAAVTAGVLLPSALLLAVGVSITMRVWNGPHAEHHWKNMQLPTICRYVDSVTKPGDSIYVWGFRGSIYLACNRPPASRYVVSPEVAGWVPWYPGLTLEQENGYAAPGSRQGLIDDLEHAHAQLIIDAPGAGMGGRSITRYRILARYVSQHYCKAKSMLGMTFYRHRDAAGRCRP